MQQSKRIGFNAGMAAAIFAALGPRPVEAQLGTEPTYVLPPAAISQVVDTPPTASVQISPDGKTTATLPRSGLPTIAELSQPELRLAGVRINPATNGPSRGTYFTAITFGTLAGGAGRAVQLPTGAKISFPSWSPDGSRLAFVNTTASGLELWVAEVATATAKRLTGPELNAAFGSPFQWLAGGRELLVRRVVPGRGPAPTQPAVPTGPIIQENLGVLTPSRTYQDLLDGSHDEALFDYYFTSQLARVSLDGAVTLLGAPGLYSSVEASPSGEYVLVSSVKRPYSYIVPFSSFGGEVSVLDATGATVRKVIDRTTVTPATIGRDVVHPGPRNVSWRADVPATLVWVEAADGGDPRSRTTVRDRVLALAAPFASEPTILVDLDQRFAGIRWGRADLALVTTRWATTARTKTLVIDPSRPGQAGRVLFDLSSEDSYANPGQPVMTTNASGEPVLLFSSNGRSIYLTGQGASPRGIYPFLDRLELRSGAKTRLWQNEDPYYETVSEVLDPDARRILTQRESATEPPNYFVRDLRGRRATALTNFTDPAPQFAGVKRQIVTYSRADGVPLNATLYTPPGYDAARDGRLPVIMWAYPREFRDADAAGQITESPNRFSRPGGSSHLVLLLAGYAILDGPAVPIIGEGDAEPNDTYIEQLVSSMQAAADKVVEMGVGDRDRMGVGGHSYGAFMTANLLAHSNIFRAGVARSGAYNRTLTPFGFQAEPRTYWEASSVYLAMSPFNYADKVDEPILLIHGEADNNSGTFPIQSERMYAALQGHGATVRYVRLPHESHGYAGRESVLHTQAETLAWFDRYVKNAAPRSVDTSR